MKNAFVGDYGKYGLLRGVKLGQRAKTIVAFVLMSVICFGCGSEDTVISNHANNTMDPGKVEDEGMVDQGEGIEDMTSAAIVSLMIDGESYNVDTDANSTAKSFFQKVSSESLKLKMSDYGGFEKNATLPWELTTDEDEQITAKPGDIVLYQGNMLVILYEENTANYTKIGSISEPIDVKDEMFKKLKSGKNVDVEIMVEYTE